MSQFDPTDWIDAQKAAGHARGNIFADILQAIQRKREAGTFPQSTQYERREARIKGIRLSAARHYANVYPKDGAGSIPTFPEMLAQQNKS